MTTLGQVRGATDRSHRTDFVLSVATSASTYKQPVALAPHLQSTRPSSHISSQPPAPAPAPPSTRNGHSVATFVTPSSSSSSSSSSSLSSTSISPVDANFKAGIKLIQQAYEDKYQALIEEVNTWKWISEEQSAQMAAMAAELARVEDNYAALQKEMAQLEMFRKAIISMVDQHSGVSMSQLEQSIMETIEADTENGDKVQDADTSSFMLDDDVKSAAQPSRHTRDEILLREYKAINGSTQPTSFKSSPPMMPASRPRASTEASKRSNAPYSSSRPALQTGDSYLRQNGATNPGTRSNGVPSDSTPTEIKRMTKSESAENVRSKRSTISTSSGLIYPNTAPLSHSGSTKRHSSLSPLSPKTRALISSSRVATGGSTSFSPALTPSTSSYQHNSSMAVSSIAGSITARTAKQHQQHKESSLNVRNSMSHMVSVPGFTPLSTAPHSDPRHYSSDNSSPAGQSKFGSTHVSQSGARHHRSGSDSASTSGLSPAAMRLLRQQEQQKQLEKGEESFPKGTGHTRHGSHQTDDEDYRRTGARSAGNRSGSARSHHQRRTSDSGHVSGYESSSRQPSSARYLKSESHAMAMANDNNSSQRKGGGVDASAFTMLYKEIRDSMDAISFGLFARVVTSFNEGDKTTEETLDEVGMIVKDRALNQRFRDLIHQAIAEKESQMENENGNETIEPDLTMEIDKSLLMDNGDVIAEEDEEGEEEEKERKYARQLDDRDSHTTNGAARQHEYDYDTSVQLDVDHESMMQERSPPRLLDPEESLLEAMERTHLGEAKIVDLSKEATLSSEEASSGALMKVRE